MPDDNPGDPKTQQPAQQGESGTSPSPPPPPEKPDPIPAQPVSRQEVQAEVNGIKDRVRRAELWMIGLTAAIAFFGLCSVGVGLFQWCAMRGQLGEMGKQTKLIRDQLSSSQGAVVNISPEIENHIVQEGTNALVLHIRNNSPSTASGFFLTFNIIRQSVPDGHVVWKSDDIKLGPEDLVATPAGENRGPNPRYQFELSGADIQALRDMRMTISVKGVEDYWNGFERTKPPVCFDYLWMILNDKNGVNVRTTGPEFHSCSEYESQINSWLNTKREWEQKERNLKNPN